MMASAVFHRVMRYRLCLVKATSLRSIRIKSDKSHKSALTTTTILMQDGINMQELPVIVRKLKNVIEPFDAKLECNYSTKFTSGENDIHKIIHKEFGRCSTVDDVISLLTKCSTITPNIALGAVERIYDLNDNSCYVLPIEKLIDIIKQNEDVYAILRALRTISSRDDRYLAGLLDEILERIADNKLSISQLCDTVTFLHSNRHIDRFTEGIEKCWVGFVGREKEFDEENLVKSFAILHCLRTSRKIVLGSLEKILITIWWQLKSGTIIEIMDSLCKNGVTSSKIYPVIGRWLNTNIHTVSEDILLRIVARFTQIGYTDQQIQKALERYVKVKCSKINSPVLMVTIMNHCSSFKIRNVDIFNGCAEYFVLNASELEPMFINSMLHPFGLLNFQPKDGSKFWQSVEDAFKRNFPKINSEDVLGIMLSCVYLQKHPLNFVPNVFNPYFLEMINSSPDSNKLRMKLKLLDQAMTLECKAYQGPLLPKDHSAKSILLDGRIRRLVNNLRDTLEAIVGNPDCLSTFVVLPRVFTTDLYIVDVMFHPKNLRSSILNLNYKSDRNVNVAILINLPDHFCSKGETLLGPQAMRIRHLRLLGMKVVTLKYDVLSRLKMHPAQLQKYITERLKEAQEALT